MGINNQNVQDNVLVTQTFPGPVTSGDFSDQITVTSTPGSDVAPNIPPQQNKFNNNLSYASLDDAEDYFSARLNTDAWDEADPKTRWKALQQATRAIDRLNFAGVPTAVFNNKLAKYGSVGEFGAIPGIYTGFPQPNYVPQTQPLQFPRNGDTVIPTDIIIACCECALAYLDGVDPETELNNLGTIHQGFAALRETYDRSISMEHFRAGIPSAMAWTHLKPYLQDPRDIKLSRV